MPPLHYINIFRCVLFFFWLSVTCCKLLPHVNPHCRTWATRGINCLNITFFILAFFIIRSRWCFLAPTNHMIADDDCLCFRPCAPCQRGYVLSVLILVSLPQQVSPALIAYHCSLA